MYEVAQVAGNKIEAARALKSLSSIMGQITSSHHGGSHSSSGSKHSNSHNHKSFGHSNVDEHQKKPQQQQIYNRDLHKIRESYKRSKDAPLTSGSSSSSSTNCTNSQSGRPVTISEMNAYNVEKNSEITSNNANNYSVNNGNDSLIKTHSSSNKKKEFFKVGEGYHKTDSCYYKTPDGGYHKLPPDSYHKMSEICYNKMPDGSFKRLNDILSNGNTRLTDKSTTNNSNSSQNKVRNQMIRFLKRSKSHTPATIKEMQKTKNKEREQRLINNNAGNRDGSVNVAHNNTANSTNRKVVVTMMENGGLPIVATSKSTKREHSTRDNSKDHRGKDKVNRF